MAAFDREAHVSSARKAGLSQEQAERLADLAAARAGRRSSAQATEEKGYPHPGNVIDLPDAGGQIVLQYGHPQEVGRNGCYMHDVVQALIDHLSVYQQNGHPLACPETAATIAHLGAAKQSILARRKDRQDRNTFQTDKP